MCRTQGSHGTRRVPHIPQTRLWPTRSLLFPQNAHKDDRGTEQDYSPRISRRAETEKSQKCENLECCSFRAPISTKLTNGLPRLVPLTPEVTRKHQRRPDLTTLGQAEAKLGRSWVNFGLRALPSRRRRYKRHRRPQRCPKRPPTPLGQHAPSRVTCRQVRRRLVKAGTRKARRPP